MTSVCTLCGENTKVPFKPTPGKPIRCRDCMDKVKQGMATKEELANEREAIKKMRSKLEESMGMKLFIEGFHMNLRRRILRLFLETR